MVLAGNFAQLNILALRDKFIDKMVGMDRGRHFYVAKKRNHGQIKGLDRYMAAKIIHHKSDKRQKEQFDQSIKESQQILTNVKIAAAREDNGADGGDNLAFEGQLASFTSVLSLDKLMGAAVFY